MAGGRYYIGIAPFVGHPLFYPLLVHFPVGKSEGLLYRRFPGGWDSAMHITFCRGVGFLALGVIPAILGVTLMPGYTLRDFGLTFRTATALYSLFWILGLGTVMAVVGYMNASRPENLDQYPQIRAKIWTPQIAIVNAAGWVFYLLAYEFLFRGILLFPLAAHLGFGQPSP